MITIPPNGSNVVDPVGRPSSSAIIFFGSPPKIDSPSPIRK
jgi:hypothetical protein